MIDEVEPVADATPKPEETREENKEELPDEIEEKQEKEEQEDTDFVLSATRTPRQGSWERFLAQGLAQASLTMDDMKRIKAVSLCAYMVQKPDRENLATDYQTVKILNTNANALLNPTIRKREDIEVYSIPWGFPETEESYQTFILPWYNCKPFHYPRLLRKHAETWRIWHCSRCTTEVLRAKLPFPDTIRFPHRCPTCHQEIIHYLNGIPQVTCIDQTTIDEEPYWSYFFEITECLSPEGYDTLKNNFVDWATELTQQILAELTKLVDPNLYDQLRRDLTEKRGKRGYVEKVKEIAEPKAEENASVDNVGPF